MKSIDERIKEHIRRNCQPHNSRNTRDVVLEYIKKNAGRRVPTLYVNNIPDNFYLYLNDECIKNPFVISSALANTIQKEVRGLSRAQDKSRNIYDWMINNIKYGKNGRKNGYKNSAEVLLTNEGVCGEMSFVYVTMARCAGLQSYYVHVDKDFRNKKVNHACANVNVGRNLFVDIAYKMYDIEHKKYQILNDFQIMQRYNTWRRK